MRYTVEEPPGRSGFRAGTVENAACFTGAQPGSIGGIPVEMPESPMREAETNGLFRSSPEEAAALTGRTFPEDGDGPVC